MIAKIGAGILVRAFQATEERRYQIQGFLYQIDTLSGDEARVRHVIRDLGLEDGQQTQWTRLGTRATYMRDHDEMMGEIERLKMAVICDWLVENSPVTTRDI